jgi:valyl-tRNA synthetase
MTVALDDPSACAHCASARLEQDPDVLDTWFSSGLWPFSTLGWPDETDDLRRYYPTSVMETGYDILFFWVARMSMSGLEFTGRAPFHTVYLHGLVRDEHGRKMSKTTGNVVDPIQLMDEFGTDALRFSLLTGSAPGNDMNINVQRVEAGRNFANKLWNATRLVLSALERAPARPAKLPAPTLADRWILARLAHLRREAHRLLEAYQFAEAGRQIYEFLWGEYADWYLEASKLQMEAGGERAWLTADTLVRVLDDCLRLLHPFMPFVTEELWQHLQSAAASSAGGLVQPGAWGEALIDAAWPMPDDFGDEPAVAEFETLRQVITAIRNVRSEKNIPAGSRLPAAFAAAEEAPRLASQRALLASLARLAPESLTIESALATPPEGAIPLVVGTIEIYLRAAEAADAGAERERLMKELHEAEAQIARLRDLLAGPFAERAPAPVVEKERQKLADFEQARQRLARQIEAG